MRLWPKRAPRPRPDPSERDLADELRSASRRLLGWRYSGTGLDLDRLILDAATELDRLAREVERLQGEQEAEAA